MGLTGSHSNYKIILDKVKQIKATTPVKSEPNPDLVDLSYNTNSTVKKLKQQQKRRFSDKEISEMIQRYRTGDNVYELAKAFGCHRSTISSVLRRNGVKVTTVKSEKIFDPVKVAELYKSGMKSKEIAEKYGVGEQTIRDSLKNQGIKMRKSWEYPKKD